MSSTCLTCFAPILNCTCTAPKPEPAPACPFHPDMSCGCSFEPEPAPASVGGEEPHLTGCKVEPCTCPAIAVGPRVYAKLTPTEQEEIGTYQKGYTEGKRAGYQRGLEAGRAEMREKATSMIPPEDSIEDRYWIGWHDCILMLLEPPSPTVKEKK